MTNELAAGLESLRIRASIAKILIGLVVLTGIASAISVVWYLQTDGLDDAYYIDEFHISDIVAIGHSIFLLASFFAVGAWIYRAHSNLRSAELPALEYSPGWAIGWYAIPIANLFKPFQAMRELWHASHGAVADYEQTAPTLLWVWWIGWLLSNIGNLSEDYDALAVIGVAFEVLSAVCIYMLVDRITKAQPGMSVAATFE